MAKEYGLSEATIYKWKNLYLPNQSTELTGKEAAELRKENARLKEELEILKKPQPYSLERPKVTCSIHSAVLKENNLNQDFSTKTICEKWLVLLLFDYGFTHEKDY
ncbi:transposase [Enterococcus faecalis]|uniref:transposase n=1 Tax=Enterococcus faecalis TaxID=1351 RepID=UPI003D137B00